MHSQRSHWSQVRSMYETRSNERVYCQRSAYQWSSKVLAMNEGEHRQACKSQENCKLLHRY